VSDLPTPLERKLTAILYADVAGYSRLTEQDEAGTHRLLSENLDRFTKCIERHGGRVEHYAGDAILAEFPSVTLAVTCALTAQSELAEIQSHIPEDRRVLFRIGINLGEVIVDRGEIYGEGVNIAARLEALAEPGGVWISDSVQREVRDQLPLDFLDLGEHKVKNIAEPIRTFRVLLREGAELPPIEPPLSRRRGPSRINIALSTGVVALLVVVALVWLGIIGPERAPELTLPDKPSLAVLPFKNLNDDVTQEYFVDGITDDLITDLSKVPELFVISSNSSSRYKNTKIDIREISRELGVRYVLTGTLRKTPRTLRLNAQLTEARSGATVWADRYDATLEQIFDLQDVIVAHVVSTVSGQSSPQEMLAGQPSRVIDIGAYDLFLQGWAHYNRETPDGYSDAIPLLTGAVERDPTFHRPHAVLAAIYYQGGLRRWHQQWGISNYDASRKAYEHLHSAMAEPTALAYSVSALMHVYNGRHEKAIEEAQKALAIDPNDPTAHIVLARALSMAGRGEKALEHTGQAMRLNPHHPASYEWTEGLAHFVGEEYSEAKSLFERSGSEHAGLDLVPLLATYGILGRMRDAQALLVVQRARWQQWHPGYPMTVRSLVAEFPPFLDSHDADRLRAGLEAVLSDP
jgi:TolB-like protein/class 3 adenylate cyclase